MSGNPLDVFSSSDENKQLNKGYKAQKKNNQKAVQATKNATAAGSAALLHGQDSATQALNAGNAQAQGYYDKALPSWQALQNTGQSGIDMYGNLVGLNGADMAATLGKIPGYNWSVDQALQALDRTANSRGMLKSGNNSLDILNAINGIASQNYFNYAKLFDPYFNLAPQAAQGISNVYGQKASSANQLGSNLSNVYTGTANSLNQDQQWQGGQLADIYTGQGNQANNYYTNRANAGSAADSNTWNALLNGAKLAAGAA